MMKSKRMIAGMLAALLLMSACAGSTVEDETDTAVDTQDTSAPEESESAEETVVYEEMSIVERLQQDRSDIADNLPEKDYDGYSFRMQGASDTGRLRTLEETADLVDSAMYNVQIAVEDRFNVNLVDADIADYTDWNTYSRSIINCMQAQEDILDILTVWNTMAADLVTQGFFYDLSTIDTFDFSKPWFHQEAIDSLSYKGHIFLSADTSSTTPLESMQAVFFNKEMAEDNGIPDLYETVRNDEWTLDYFKTLLEGTYVDYNGNGTVDKEKDRFGASFTTAQFGYCGVPTFGTTLIEKDADDVPFLNITENLERFETVYSTLRNLFNNPDHTVICDSEGETNAFCQGHVLFCMYKLGPGMDALRDTETEYGVLPLFKWDETQENYGSAYLPMPNAIPNTVSDPERCAIILTALAAGGYKEVYPAYYDKVLKSRYVRDEESAEMIDLIANNLFTDGSILYLNANQGIYFFSTYAGDEREFVSFFESMKKGMEGTIKLQVKKLEKLIK